MLLHDVPDTGLIRPLTAKSMALQKVHTGCQNHDLRAVWVTYGLQICSADGQATVFLDEPAQLLPDWNSGSIPQTEAGGRTSSRSRVNWIGGNSAVVCASTT